jgi:hypothetical protein
LVFDEIRTRIKEKRIDKNKVRFLVQSLSERNLHSSVYIDDNGRYDYAIDSLGIYDDILDRLI